MVPRRKNVGKAINRQERASNEKPHEIPEAKEGMLAYPQTTRMESAKDAVAGIRLTRQQRSAATGTLAAMFLFYSLASGCHPLRQLGSSSQHSY